MGDEARGRGARNAARVSRRARRGVRRSLARATRWQRTTVLALQHEHHLRATRTSSIRPHCPWRCTQRRPCSETGTSVVVDTIIAAGVGGSLAALGTYLRVRAELRKLRAAVAAHEQARDERRLSKCHDAFRSLLDHISDATATDSKHAGPALVECERSLNEVLLVGG